MSTHTHETWHAAKMANDHQGIVIEDITGRNVALVYDRTDTALLAAAPELLEALKEAREWLDECVLLNVQEKIDKAIAKAEGRS